MNVPWRCGRRGAGQSRPGLECQRGFGDRRCAAHQDSVEPQRTKKTDLEVLLDLGELLRAQTVLGWEVAGSMLPRSG